MNHENNDFHVGQIFTHETSHSTQRLCSVTVVHDEQN